MVVIFLYILQKSSIKVAIIKCYSLHNIFLSNEMIIFFEGKTVEMKAVALFLLLLVLAIDARNLGRNLGKLNNVPLTWKKPTVILSLLEHFGHSI